MPPLLRLIYEYIQFYQYCKLAISKICLQKDLVHSIQFRMLSESKTWIGALKIQGKRF